MAAPGIFLHTAAITEPRSELAHLPLGDQNRSFVPQRLV
jgi:hypothetical protein